MTERHVFGYGSLVNCATHDYDRVAPAQLVGWQRVWRHLPGRDFATLSVEAVEKEQIFGLVARVAEHHWTGLDHREALYRRVDVRAAERLVTLYEVPTEQSFAPDPAPILLSYVDVVVQGYHRLGGEAAVAAFFGSTMGWGAIHDDRADPIYARHQMLSREERAMVDRYLAKVD